MRITGEYLAKAAAFEAMADFVSDPVDKKRYAALAENYRHLARERQWMMATEAIKPARSHSPVSGVRDSVYSPASA
jgi:hypothetical protein